MSQKTTTTKFGCKGTFEKNLTFFVLTRDTTWFSVKISFAIGHKKNVSGYILLM